MTHFHHHIPGSSIRGVARRYQHAARRTSGVQCLSGGEQNCTGASIAGGFAGVCRLEGETTTRGEIASAASDIPKTFTLEETFPCVRSAVLAKIFVSVTAKMLVSAKKTRADKNFGVCKNNCKFRCCYVYCCENL